VLGREDEGAEGGGSAPKWEVDERQSAVVAGVGIELRSELRRAATRSGKLGRSTRKERRLAASRRRFSRCSLTTRMA
jgi:hypothetical protein